MTEKDARASFAARYVGMIADTYLKSYRLDLGIYSLYSVYKGEKHDLDLYTIVDEHVAKFQKILDSETPDDPHVRLFQYLTGPERIPSDLDLKVPLICDKLVIALSMHKSVSYTCSHSQVCKDFSTSGDILNDALRSGRIPASLLVILYTYIARGVALQSVMYQG